MNEKTPQKAQRMILDLLLLGISGEKIAKGTKISAMTISSIKNGRNQRISEKVFDKIWNFYDEKAPPRTEMEKLREEKGNVELPQQKPEEKAAPKSKTEKPDSGTPTAPKRPVKDFSGFISTDYVPVNLKALNEQIDGLISQFQSALDELNAIKAQIK